MAQVMVGIGDIGVAVAAGDTVRTMALGSCVAICLLDKRTRCIGMAHVALPESSISPERAQQKPGHFADTAVPALIKAMKIKAGAVSRGPNLIVKLAGGANVADINNTFNIGKRNILAVRKALWKVGLGPVAEDVGKTFSRTVTIYQETGKITINCPGRGSWEL